MNLGFAEYSGENTVVDVAIVDADGGDSLGEFEAIVPAFSHVQILRIFRNLSGLEDIVLEAANAVITAEEGGAIYSYATVIDNRSGDPTAFIAATD